MHLCTEQFLVSVTFKKVQEIETAVNVNFHHAYIFKVTKYPLKSANNNRDFNLKNDLQILN